MASITTVVENLESTPNLGALGNFTNPIVMVTKVTQVGTKKTEQLIVNAATGLSASDILKLQDDLPLGKIANSGPGFYKFDVTDQDSGAKMVWQVKLGSSAIDNPTPEAQARPVSIVTGRPGPVVSLAAPAPPAPLASDAQNMGNGWVYTPSLGVMAAPDGSMHQWKPGAPLPTMQQAVQPVVQQPAQQQYASTQVGQSTYAGPNPETESLRQQLAAMQAALAASSEREREAQRQTEIRDLQSRMEKALEENNKRFEALVSQIAQPRREDDRVLEMERRLAEKERLDSIRMETKAQIDALAALVQSGVNRGPDPMVNMLTTLLGQQQVAAAENLRVMREASAQERAIAKDLALTPERMFQMMERQAMLTKDTNQGDIMTKVLGGVDMLFERMSRLNQMEREMGGGGGGVDWMSVIKEVGGKAGSAFQMYQSAKSKEAQAATVTAQAKIAQAQAQVITVRAQGQRKQQQQQQLAAPRTAETLAAQAQPAPTNPPVPARAPSSPTPAPVFVAADAVIPPPAPVSAPVVKEPHLSDATLTDLRSLFNEEGDALFFGDFLQYIEQLREEVNTNPGEVTADDIASYLLDARSFIAEEVSKGNIPHAAELLVHGQIEYIVERALPEVNEGLRSEISKSIQRALAAEADAERIAAAAGSSAS